MYCTNCGTKLNANDTRCPRCGDRTTSSTTMTYSNNTATSSQPKSQLGAAFLALFFGIIGMHQFYLGYNGKGIAMILLTILGSCVFIGPFISIVWAFIDAIRILTGSYVDAQGNPLQN